MTLQTEQALDYRAAPASEPLAPLAPGPTRLAWRAAAVCFLLVLLMNLPYLGMTPLAGTEGHRALTAHEMVRSGQWLVPMLFGRPYLAKPPLHYWLIAAAESLTGGPRPGAPPLSLFVWKLPSALCGGLLAAVVCLFTSRWYGRAAAWVAGGCAVGMIALWGERQVADIDATNNLFSTLAALAGVELLFGRPRRQGLWILGTGLALAATLMTKGPAGLAIVAGVWGWAAARAVRERRAGRLASPRYWLPLLIGTAVFVSYASVVWLYLRRRGIDIDYGGLQEGQKMLYPSSFKRMRLALEVPPMLLLYALPVSLALPAWFALPVRRVADETERQIGTALAAAVLIGWGVGLASGMANPRYGYPTLPALCPLAGATAAVALRLGGKAADWLRAATIGSAVTMAGVAVALAVMARKQPGAAPYLIGAGVLAVAAAAYVWRGIPVSWRAARALLLLPVLASVPFGFQRCLARTPTSGLYMVPDLVRRAGERPVVAMAKGLTWKPEIFYYADARASSYIPPLFDPAHVPPGRWLFMDQNEYHLWRRLVGKRLSRDKLFRRGGESDYYLGWYGDGEPTRGDDRVTR